MYSSSWVPVIFIHLLVPNLLSPPFTSDSHDGQFLGVLKFAVVGHIAPARTISGEASSLLDQRIWAWLQFTLFRDVV